MQNNNTILIIAAIGAFLWYTSQHPQPGPTPGPGPAVVVPAELQPMVSALAAFPPQKAEVAHFYEHFSSAVASSDQLQTLGQFKLWNQIAVAALVRDEGYSGPQQYGAAIDAYLAKQLGNPTDANQKVDAATKATLSSSLKTISQVLSQ